MGTFNIVQTVTKTEPSVGAVLTINLPSAPQHGNVLNLILASPAGSLVDDKIATSITQTNLTWGTDYDKTYSDGNGPTLYLTGSNPAFTPGVGTTIEVGIRSYYQTSPIVAIVIELDGVIKDAGFSQPAQVGNTSSDEGDSNIASCSFASPSPEANMLNLAIVVNQDGASQAIGMTNGYAEVVQVSTDDSVHDLSHINLAVFQKEVTSIQPAGLQGEVTLESSQRWLHRLYALYVDASVEKTVVAPSPHLVEVWDPETLTTTTVDRGGQPALIDLFIVDLTDSRYANMNVSVAEPRTMTTLDLDVAIDSIMQRQLGMVVGVNSAIDLSYPIAVADPPGDYFTVTGEDLYSSGGLDSGDKFTVSGSPANDGTYTVVVVTVESGDTRVYVSEEIPDGTAGGDIIFTAGTINKLAMMNLGVMDFTPFVHVDRVACLMDMVIDEGITRKFAINDVDQISDYFNVDEDPASPPFTELPVGSDFLVTGSPGNDGMYTVQSLGAAGGETQLYIAPIQRNFSIYEAGVDYFVIDKPTTEAPATELSPGDTIDVFGLPAVNAGTYTIDTIVDDAGKTRINVDESVTQAVPRSVSIYDVSPSTPPPPPPGDPVYAYFEVDSLVTNPPASEIGVGSRFEVTGSTGNDGFYTIIQVEDENGRTQLYVNETIPDATADGSITYNPGGAINYQVGIPDSALGGFVQYSIPYNYATLDHLSCLMDIIIGTQVRGIYGPVGDGYQRLFQQELDMAVAKSEYIAIPMDVLIPGGPGSLKLGMNVSVLGFHDLPLSIATPDDNRYRTCRPLWCAVPKTRFVEMVMQAYIMAAKSLSTGMNIWITDVPAAGVPTVDLAPQPPDGRADYTYEITDFWTGYPGDDRIDFYGHHRRPSYDIVTPGSFEIGTQFKVVGSDANDGTYTVNDIYYVGGYTAIHVGVNLASNPGEKGRIEIDEGRLFASMDMAIAVSNYRTFTLGMDMQITAGEETQLKTVGMDVAIV